ncbi:hypothetical protein CJF32_00007215 [Rutstroemia sp. NJR-2017a WRK4]|nr:hypothetical protein CJF32_00007215 [Rutstroemia sp. NJR-2017a WRK4]
MSTSGIDELTNEAPPVKRARTESSTSTNSISTSALSASMNTSDNILPNISSGETSDQQATGKDSSAMSQTFSGIPGLGRIGHAPATPVKVEESAAEVPTVKDEASLEGTRHEQLPTDNGNQEDSKMANSEPSQENAEFTNNAATAEPHFEMKDEASNLVQSVSQPADPVLDIPQESNTNEKVEGENAHTEMEVEVEATQVPANAAADTEKPAESLSGNHMEHISPTGMAGVQTEMVEAKQASTNSTANTEHNPQTHMDGIQTDAVDESSPPELTHALEALLGGLSEPAISTATATAIESTLQPTEEEHPEWEIDSSPYESSSDDSSSDDSSSEDSDEEDGENSYKLLSPEEQARILMEGDGGSDDEGAAKGAKGTGAQVRTKNEIPEEVIPKPDVTITPEMPIQELGNVETMVEGVVLIKAKTSGEYRVLREESVLCLEDRSVIGVVSDTLGRVEQPLYCVRFTNADAIAEAGLSLGTKIFYSEQHSTYVFTQALKAYKGSDASNLHDEEVGDEEMEFSDDEAEMEHKRKIKQKRMEKRGGKMQQNGGSGHSGHPLQQSSTPGDSSVGLSYDEAEDGPYKTLARPAGYTGGAGGEAPQEGSHHNRQNHRGDGGRSRGRGRGDRGRGDRGRGRGVGGHNDRNKGYSLPPQMQTNNGFAPPNPSPGGFFNAQPPPLLQGYSPSPQPYPQNNLYNNANTPQYSPQQPQMWPPYPQNFQQGYQQPFTNPPNVWPGMPPPPPLPSGAFINPAFFNQMGAPNQWNQPGPQNGNDRSKQ